MGSQVNFKNFVDAVGNEGINPKQAMAGSFPLARQNSVFSLTFDEFQNTWGGLRKDFGSMNMDELLKSIWTAEESQAMINNNNSSSNNGNSNITSNNNNSSNNSFSVGVGEVGVVYPGGNLQRQGSYTLPRTLSQKTVDEVWRYLTKETENGGGGGGGNGGSSAPQRQQTLGEITLEEFLVRAGVVREDPQPLERPHNINGGFYGFGSNTNAGLAQSAPGLSGNSGFASNGAGVRSSRLPPQSQPIQMQPQVLPQQQQEAFFPKQATLAFADAMNMVNGSHPMMQGMSSVVGIADRPINSNLLQAVDYKTGVTVAAVSPGSQMSPDLTPKSNTDASLSPVPFVFGRGRRSSAALEKVIERRQRRMIKNRESAARSRARKQAYTLELEAEVEKLKKLNQELQKKQAEIMEVQKNKLLEPMRQPWGCKRQCLRRTLTGPW